MASKVEYVVYNDGLEWRRCETEDEAKEVVSSYDGDHEVWYESEEVEEDAP